MSQHPDPDTLRQLWIDATTPDDDMFLDESDCDHHRTRPLTGRLNYCFVCGTAVPLGATGRRPTDDDC